MFKNFKNSIFKQVFYFNLLYANPTITANAMKKKQYGDTPEDIFRRLLMKSYLMSSVFVLVVYTLIFLVIPLNKAPYYLDYTILVFFLLCILQTFTYFFNVFYNSKDIEGYMSLPIEESLVYRAKMAVVAIATIQMAIPIWSITSIYGFKMGLGYISILYGFLDFVLAGSLVVIVNMILMEGLAKTSVLSKFKNGIITAINIVATLANISIIVFLQTTSKARILSSQIEGRVEYGFISSLAKSHMGNLGLILVLSLVILGIYALIMKSVNGRFYDYIRKIQDGSGQKKRPAKENMEASHNKVALESISDFSIGSENGSEARIGLGLANETSQTKEDKKGQASGLGFSLFKYNLSLINEPTVITQSIVMNCAMPIFLFLPVLMDIRKEAATLELIRTNSGIAAVIIALVVAIFINAFSTTLSSIVVSLDRENYYYIKSLPISRKQYFMSKLIISTGINSILPMILILGVYIYVGIPVFDIVYALVLYIILCLSISSLWLIYDFKNVVTDWQNVSDIYGRLNKALVFVLTFLIFIVCFAMVMLLSFVLSLGLGTQIRSAFTILILIFAIFSLSRVRNFTKKSGY